MAVTAAAPETFAKRSLNRMDDWANDDLLLTASARERLEADFPGALRVFDWPELREQFESIDKRAAASRLRRRRGGVIAATVTSLGAALSAVLPLAEPLGWDVERGVYALAAVVSFAGLLATLWLTHGDRHVAEWLESRLQTERLRQLYFQVLVSDPALAARALSDDTALTQWRERRDKALRTVTPTLFGAARSELLAIVEDVNLRRLWLIESFRVEPLPLSPSPELGVYFSVMRRQRLGVQADHVREKLADGWGSPRTWHAVVRGVSYASAVSALALSIGVAILLYNGLTFGALPIRIFVSLMAFTGVVSMFFKLLGEGLQVRADKERYLSYRDAVTELDARFNDRDPDVRAEILRDMERASYRELREFLKTHKGARFSFG
ncbi:MAG: hypothetical protein AB7H66_14795 [Hyphomonadaceae bacterium]